MTTAANTAYSYAYNDTIKLLVQVQNLIDERAEKLEGADIRWPQAGDMAHVAGKLAEILEFLKG
jgi:hypothetical protein